MVTMLRSDQTSGTINTMRYTAGFLLIFSSASALFAAGTLNVKDFGAKGDGTSKDTQALQKAIDGAEQQGGGTVVVPAGKYLIGTIHLKNNVTLQLENGSTILASTDNADFDP